MITYQPSDNEVDDRPGFVDIFGFTRPMDRGHHIVGMQCFCGKMLVSYQAHKDHYTMKHPKMFSKMKRAKIWQQVQYDWRTHSTQLQANNKEE